MEMVLLILISALLLLQLIQGGTQASYTVLYTFTDDQACVNTTTITLLINDLPEPTFRAERGNTGVIGLGVGGDTFQVCEADLSTSTGAIADRIVLLNDAASNSGAYGPMVDGTFKGRITTASLNLDISDNALILQNLDAAVDGNNDGEAYFYPGAAIDAANTNPVLALEDAINFQFTFEYTNDRGCIGTFSSNYKYRR